MGQDESTMAEASGPPVTLTDRSLEAVADYINGGKVKRIVVLTGAGISTGAGIPDFRSPKTGLYNHLARLNLPYAEAVFDISYFRSNPEPFYVLAQELYPGRFHPTVSHAFIALLAKKGLLVKLFTQNIDCLERAAGVPPQLIVEAHGSFATQRCIDCHVEYPDEDMRSHVLAGEVPTCPACKGLVKPDITFFGEALPRVFSEQSYHVTTADLVLIIGTSLSVYPFASLPNMAREDRPRVLFNKEKVGSLGSRVDDVLELGSCDDGIRRLADILGWRDELEKSWRDVVGDAEAERQLRSQQERDDEVEDEVLKLTEEVEALLSLQDDGGGDNDNNKKKDIKKEEDTNHDNLPIDDSTDSHANVDQPEKTDMTPSHAAPTHTDAAAAAAADSEPPKTEEEKASDKSHEKITIKDSDVVLETEPAVVAKACNDAGEEKSQEKEEEGGGSTTHTYE